MEERIERHSFGYNVDLHALEVEVEVEDEGEVDGDGEGA
jgi:hypothetical protein